MKNAPPQPSIDEAPDALTETGHLWLLEYIDGAPLRFQVQDSGLIRFGDSQRVFHPEEIPVQYHHAVRYVREHLDREALRSAVDDVEEYVFFGTATYRQDVAYDWARLPSFVGTDVWSGSDGRYLTFDTVENALDRLGLDAVNAFERELPARDFDPDSYTVPESAWYDGPAAGVVVRNKRGQRGQMLSSDVESADAGAIEGTADEIASELATEERFEAVEQRLGRRNESATVDALAERVFEAIVREQYQPLVRGPERVDLEELRAAVATRARAYLGYS
ncbi:RNA ligase family protein [Natronomonas amylolytica]|uniref:RNA ligase family protein n=1 Tax=Natronomonas amylolytica TaxID=3108498 RepID=UPI0030094805